MRPLLFLTFMIATQLHSAELTSWKTLPPLPDPIGFGGMVAGVTKGTLFTAGGSRFVDKPVWDGGTKGFSDKVFVLSSPDGPWKELAAKLPIELAHSACAPFGDAVYSVGGVNAKGALDCVYRFELQGDQLKADALPPLPHPLVYGSAAVVQDVLYVFGGVPDAASTQPLAECWALPLKEGSSWQRLPDLPGKPGIVCTSGSDGKSLYVFGGMHYLPPEDGKTRPVPLDNVYRFDPATQKWAQLNDMPVARVGAASPAPYLPDGRFFLAGGYGSVFPGLPKDNPGFERESLIFSPGSDAWKEGPLLPCHRQIDATKPTAPGPEPMVAAPAVLWHDMVVLISGEVRPATRTPAVIGIPLSEIR